MTTDIEKLKEFGEKLLEVENQKGALILSLIAALEAKDAEIERTRCWFEKAKKRGKSWMVRATAAEAALKEARELLGDILRCEYDGHGLFDCIDNDGKHYPSAYLAKRIKAAEFLLGGAPVRPPQDVIDLVTAAREVMDAEGSSESIRALDKKLEAFASRVPYEDEARALLSKQDSGERS